jgi:hypothetical protein
MVNRLWEQLFGYGIAETLEDLGTQGITPTHKDLLDYLAFQFANDYNWSIKKVLKEMVLSSTYRQDSKFTKELIEKDPNNKLYARGPRVRLSGEQIRDQALSVSNVLSHKMYGKSVMPFQPDGVWKSPYASEFWIQSQGEDLFRRAVYTYWKRSAPYPSMLMFDGGTRDVCVTRRIRTNTPLQALTILNDSSFLVMARFFANRMNEIGGKDINSKIGKGYEAMMYKSISAGRLNALVQLYNNSLEKYQKNAMARDEIAGDLAKNNPSDAAMVIVATPLAVAAVIPEPAVTLSIPVFENVIESAPELTASPMPEPDKKFTVSPNVVATTERSLLICISLKNVLSGSMIRLVPMPVSGSPPTVDPSGRFIVYPTPLTCALPAHTPFNGSTVVCSPAYTALHL